MRHAPLVGLALVAAACTTKYERPADLPRPEAWRPPSAAADSVRPFYDSLAAARLAGLPARPAPLYDLRTNLNPADSAGMLQWFQLLRDSTLQRLVAVALRENYDARIAVARIAEFRALYGVTRGELFPQLTVGGSAGTFRRPLLQLDTTNTFSSIQLSADVAWELDFFGRIRNATQAARADLLAQEESRRAVLLALVADVATAYLELRELDANLAIARRTLASRLETLRLAQRRFQEGVISELDVRQFESEVAFPAARVAEIERQVRAKENQLSVLLGRTPVEIPRGRTLDDVVAGIAVPAGLPSALVERRPDVRQAEQAYSAATSRVGAARGELLPTITLNGSYGTLARNWDDLFQQSSELYGIGGAVSIPIFTGGRVGKQVDVARARAEQAGLQYRKAIITAFREVEDAMAALRASRDLVAATATQVQALRAAERLATRRYENGISSYLEVLDAQRNLFSAELNLTAAQRQQVTSAVQLYRSLGGGWPVVPGDTLGGPPPQ